MIRLAFDTSNKPLVVVLADDQKILASYVKEQPESHSTILLPVINQLLKEQNLKIEEIDQLIIASGPGSFTGLRIGATVAKVMAKGLEIPLIPVSSLAAIAAEQKMAGNTAVYFDARNDNVFAGIYTAENQKLIEDQHLSFQQFKQLANQHQAQLIDGLNFDIKGSGLLAMANQSQPLTGQAIDQFVPNYLRQTQAELNWQKDHKDLGVLDDGFVQEI